MASSPSNLQSEPLKIEQIITEFFAKSMRIILESRSIYASSRRNYSGTVSSPSSSSSSSSVRPRDKWFNLVLGECPASLENLDFLRQSNHEPLVIDIVLIQRSENPDAVRPPPSKGSHPKNPSLRDQFLGGWNAGQEQFISEAKRETIIERWTVQYESRKNSGILRDLSSGTKKMGSSTSSHSSETPTLFFKKIYKRSIILLRSLYLTVRLLPAYKLFRDLNSSGKICPFSLAYRVSPFVETFTRREEAEMQPFNFVPVDTTCGKLSLSVLYRRTLLDVSSEPSTPISTQFISDYVGSPTTDPLRRFPSLPLTQSPASPSPVTFARWNSWSNDLHCATPSFSSSPSPTHSDSHALPSKPSSHHLPPRSHVNMNFLHPVSSTHRVPPHTSHLSTESLVHKKNLSFDETWPSPPFSPSPSPSPPTHIGSHPSKALMRTESAPVSIPSARLRQSCGLPNTVLPPSRSPKGTRPGRPPPRAVASVLRSKSIEFLEKWHGSFGIHYRQLRSAFDYLKHTLMFQFPNRLEAAARLQQERREREIRSKEILLSKFETLRGSYSSIKGEIQLALEEITECLDIVRVKEDEFVPMGSVEEDGVVEIRSFSFQQLRLVSLKEGKRVHENSDNKAVFDVLRELYKLLVSRHLSSVQEWISVLVRVDSADNKVRDSILKEFIDLQNSVRAVKKRCEQLGFALPSTLTREEEEDLWEEGKIEISDSENIRAPNMPSEEIASSSVADAGKGKAPDSSKTLKSGKVSSLEGDGSRPKSSKRKLFSEAPVMPWGSFLDSWGSSSDVLANQRGLEVEGHWGRVDYDAVIPAKKIAELNVQVTVYKEQHQEIRPCLAPLSKGGLCQRRDLRMCPFHGPIMPRDAEGNPINRSELSVSDKTAEELSTLVDGENRLELGNTIAEQLARQAIKNVRNRDGEEKKKEDYKRLMKRVQLAKVREHNETVLRNAALASTSRSEAIEGDVAMVHLNRRLTKGRKQTLASMLREKVTTKDRIAKKLLNSNVTDAAVRQLRQGEEANYREAFPNQW